MGVEYRALAMPDVSDFDYRPTRSQIVSLLQYLEHTGWVGEPGEPANPEYPVYLTAHAAKAALSAQPLDRPLRLYLAGARRRRFESWPDEESIFDPALCADVEIVDSPHLIAIPEDMNGGSIPCPDCDDDLSQQIQARLSGPMVEDPLEDLEGNDYHLLPGKCSACEKPVDTAALRRVQEYGEVERPAFRFAVALRAAFQPEVGSVDLAPEVIERFRSILGVSFRLVGLYE
jgi:hypothetical protein